MNICDPNVLPLEITELIFEYLPLKELLNASLVSKSWFKVIGSSEHFKKNAVINIYHWDWENKVRPSIKKSSREYETLNVRLYDCKQKGDLLKLFECKEWRKVHFNVSRLPSQNTFVTLVEKLSAVKELSVMNVQVRELKKHEKLQLLDLEHLTLSDIAIDVFYTFMSHQPSLRKLTLRFITFDILSKETSGQVIVQFLKLNNQIRELELNEDVTNDLFLMNVGQEVTLKLKSLSMGLEKMNEVVQLNIETFLKSQESSLEHLEFIFRQRHQVHYSYWKDDEDVAENSDEILLLYKIWNNLTSLKSLSLRFLKNYSEPNHQLPKNINPNPNIRSLYIRHINCSIPNRVIRHIISLCPNLNSLYISNFSTTILISVASSLRLLKQISFIIDENHAVNHYDVLKNSNAKGLNKFIKISKEYLG